MDANIKSVGNEVAHPLTDMHLECKFRILGQKRLELWAQNIMPKATVNIYTQSPANFSTRARGTYRSIRDTA